MSMVGPEPLGTPASPIPPRTLLPIPWALWFWRQARKIVIAVIGGTLILLGIIMLVIPGPGWLTIFGGLAVLASEFAWAKWLLKHAQERAAKLMEAAKSQVSRSL